MGHRDKKRGIIGQGDFHIGPRQDGNRAGSGFWVVIGVRIPTFYAVKVGEAHDVHLVGGILPGVRIAHVLQLTRDLENALQ